MTRYHVFGLQSRLGMIHPSLGQTSLNKGVELGPETLQEAFPEWLSEQSEIDMITFPNPENISPDNALEDIGTLLQEAKDSILTHWEPGQTAVFLGGDHSISLATIGAVLQRNEGKRVAILQFDSHGDLHLPSTSPSGNFHGMWFRAVVDSFPVDSIDAIVPNKLLVNQWRLIGNPVLEAEEERFLKENNSRPLTSAGLQDNAGGLTQELIDLIQVSDHVHISFDIDIFQSGLVPGTGTPNTKGMNPSEVWPILNTVLATIQITGAELSLDLVELNPSRDVKEKTLQLSLEVLERLLRRD